MKADKARTKSFQTGVTGRLLVPALATALLTLGLPTSSSLATGKQGHGPRIDPTYNVCRGTDPRCYNDWGTQRENKVLVYSRTAGPRHANLGRQNILDPDHPSNAGMGFPRPYIIQAPYGGLTDDNVAQNALIRLLSAEGIQVDVTEDVQAIERLSDSYKAVIFMSPTRDTLWNHAAGAEGGTRLDRARETLKKYMEGGGGFVGIHNALGTEYGWPWYEGLLGNANYYSHGANQDGEIVTINGHDVSTRHLPRRWAFKDEWYNMIPFPSNVNFLLVVDEKTLPEGPGREGDHPGHGDFHPVAWCQYYDGGRSWVTTLGHDSDAFREGSDFPGAAEFQSMIVAAVKSVMGLEPFCKGGHRGWK